MTPLPLIAGLFVLGALACDGGGRAAATVAAVALLGVGATKRVGRVRGARALALCGAAFAVGWARAAEVPVVVPRGRATIDAGLVRGRVVEGCTPDARGVRCVVERDGDGARVLVRAGAGGCAAAPGDVVEAVATTRGLAPEANGRRLGLGGAALRRGVAATAEVASCERVGSRAGVMDALRRAGLWTRAALARGVARSLDARAADRARALLFGDAGAIDEGDAEAFRASGLAHLLAVSGAHVALLAAWIGGAARGAMRRWHRVAARGWVEPLAAMVALPATALFVLATGESPSSLRALLGAALGACASLAGRRADGEAVVAASAAVMLAVSPAIAHDAGWQLSVVAAWALARAPRAGRAVERAPSLARSLRAFFGEGLAASARVALAVAPVLAWHFRQTPASAIVLNAVAAPLAEAVALPAVLAAAVLGLVAPPVGALVGLATAPVLDALFATPRAALALPWATAATPPPTGAQACALVCAGLAALRASARGRVAVALAALVVVGALEAVHLRAARPRGVLRVTALDVGQGDAILVDLPDGEAMLIDAGGAFRAHADPGARVVVPALADRRRGRLAVVVASHPHPDHVGGLAAVFAYADVREFWDTGQGEREGGGAPYAAARAGAAARGARLVGPSALCGPPRAFHGATLEVLAPCPGVRDGVAPNDGSFVIRIDHGAASVLLPGDLERAGEAEILPRLRPVTMLKVGHHGSRTSSTEGFLAALAPRVAVASAGHPSPFGHPHAEVVARFARRGIPFHDTATSGAVAVTLRADGGFSVATGAAWME